MMTRPIPLAAALLALVFTGVASAADSPVGDWITEGNKAKVRIAPCAGSPEELCGVITWAYRPPDAPATGPLLDIHNKDAKLRTRPIEGLPLIQGFKSTGPGKWDGGTIYDPEGG